MIEAKEVALTYGDGTKALKNVNLTVQPGELVYITGHSGSGKTSLLKLLMGIEAPTAGKLTVLGQRMRKGNDRKLRKLRRKIGPVFQEFKLIERRTALENVMVGMRILGIPPRRMKQEAAEALKKVGLEHRLHTPVEHLSWGEAQRVAIARAVVRKPVLLIADEPTGNLDHDNALNILDILTSFRDEKTAVIITTHATHLIEGQAATYIRVKEGEITIERRGEA
ncbi:MAG TPA: ABC transporter ATP-binding protein [Clostridiales bacterium]|nr:ABC transporter ATP-binding protein [Clostridiales bacterium]